MMTDSSRTPTLPVGCLVVFAAAGLLSLASCGDPFETASCSADDDCPGVDLQCVQGFCVSVDVSPDIQCVDQDDDGYFNDAACMDGAPADCNDSNPDVHPGHEELCEVGSVDNDCDGEIDEGFEARGDACTAGIGVCEQTGTRVCSDDGTSLICDAEPGEPREGGEICNGKDDDCDGVTDENCTCDYKGESTGVCKNGRIDGSSGDCKEPQHYAEKEEETNLCDGRDNDCDGETDEECDCSPKGKTVPCYTGPDETAMDTDDDNTLDTGKGRCAFGTRECESDGKLGKCEGQTRPANDESCDGIDNDCDGITDEGCDCDFLGKSDGVCSDGTLDDTGTCQPPATYDGDEERTCDGLDNDCDGETDESLTKPCSEQKGVCGGSTRSCEQGQFPSCGPNDFSQHYEADETTCDNRDNDCDGEIDEGCDEDNDGWCDAGMDVDTNNVPLTCQKGTKEKTGRDCDDSDGDIHPNAAENEKAGECTEDADSDGYGDANPPQGVTAGTDCDDADGAVHPAAPQVCDGQVNNCSAQSLPDEEKDSDSDGYVECTVVPSGWEGKPTIQGGGDCDDTDPSFNPGESERCDGLDNDCSGDIADTEKDDDSDGYVECAVDPNGWKATPTKQGDDCDDSNPAAYPGAAEEESDDKCMEDEDDDGFGDETPPSGVSAGTDCDDGAPDINPGQPEICHDQTDNDCDQKTDCADDECGAGDPCGTATTPADAVCDGTTCKEKNCSDGVDNDMDGKADCADAQNDCKDKPSGDGGTCPDSSEYEKSESSCADGIDNDADGGADCADPDDDCKGETGPDGGTCPSHTDYEAPDESTCDDGIDNDADGKADCADPDGDCEGETGPRGGECPDVNDFEATESSCDDDIDNDADGKEDCEDPDCSNKPTCQ